MKTFDAPMVDIFKYNISDIIATSGMGGREEDEGEFDPAG